MKRANPSFRTVELLGEVVRKREDPTYRVTMSHAITNFLSEIQHLRSGYKHSSYFPDNECTEIPESEEEGILEGKKPHLCVIVDDRFDDRLELMILYPYTWKGKLDPEDKVEETFFGWTTKGGERYFNNLYRGVHPEDNEHVTMFK